MWRSRSVTAARLRQIRAAAPPTLAPRMSISLLVASAAASRTARPAAVVSARRSRGPIIDAPCRGELPRTGRLRPTTKVPRKETQSEQRGQRGERPRFDRLDQRVGGGLAYLCRLFAESSRGVAGGVGVLVDEFLGCR